MIQSSFRQVQIIDFILDFIPNKYQISIFILIKYIIIFIKFTFLCRQKQHFVV